MEPPEQGDVLARLAADSPLADELVRPLIPLPPIEETDATVLGAMVVAFSRA